METFFMIMAMLNAILPVIQQVEAIVTEPKTGAKKKSMVKTIAASAGGMAVDRGASETQTEAALGVLDESIDLGVSILNMYAWKGDATGGVDVPPQVTEEEVKIFPGSRHVPDPTT